MNRTAMKSLLTVAMVGVGLVGCVPGEIGGTEDRDRTESYFKNLPQYPHMRLCAETGELGVMACHGRVVVDANGKVVSGVVAVRDRGRRHLAGAGLGHGARLGGDGVERHRLGLQQQRVEAVVAEGHRLRQAYRR
jgi:hypothetical protein